MGTDLIVALAGFVLWWAGYYAAMAVVWRSGAREVGIMVAAGAAGVCGCFGLPILAYFWTKVQSHTLATVMDGDDDAPIPSHMRHYQIAAAIAIVGLVIQLVAGRMMD